MLAYRVRAVNYKQTVGLHFSCTPECFTAYLFYAGETDQVFCTIISSIVRT